MSDENLGAVNAFVQGQSGPFPDFHQRLAYGGKPGIKKTN
jgi:hypothetical protein